MSRFTRECRRRDERAARLNAEPRELTIIHLDGTVRPEDLASLSGRVGLPKMRIGGIL